PPSNSPTIIGLTPASKPPAIFSSSIPVTVTSATTVNMRPGPSIRPTAKTSPGTATITSAAINPIMSSGNTPTSPAYTGTTTTSVWFAMAATTTNRVKNSGSGASQARG